MAEMIAARLHRALRFWLFRVPTANMGGMSPFAPIDLPFYISLPRQIPLNTVRCLKTFQHHLTVKSWPSLAELYPRPLIFTYAYLLFAWGRYCRVIQLLLDQPDRTLPAEIFLSYICTVDHTLDDVKHHAAWGWDAQAVLNLANVKAIETTLQQHIEKQPLTRDEKLLLLGLVGNYRSEALAVTERWSGKQAQNTAMVLKDKEITTGALWQTWGRMLGCLLGVPAGLAERAAQLFFHLGMMLQVIDDLGDLPVDEKIGAPNLFSALIRDVPQESEAMNDFLARQTDLFLDWPRARSLFPSAYRSLMELYSFHRGFLLQDEGNPPIAGELLSTLDRVKRLGG